MINELFSASLQEFNNSELNYPLRAENIFNFLKQAVSNDNRYGDVILPDDFLAWRKLMWLHLTKVVAFATREDFEGLYLMAFEDCLSQSLMANTNNDEVNRLSSLKDYIDEGLYSGQIIALEYRFSPKTSYWQDKRVHQLRRNYIRFVQATQFNPLDICLGNMPQPNSQITNST